MELTRLPICSSFVPMLHVAPEAVGLRDWYWDNGTQLRIAFANGDRALQEKVADIASEWTTHANLGFEFHFGKLDSVANLDIRVEFWPYGGGQSQIGKASRIDSERGRSSMYLPYSADRGIVLHEFGHALGLMHEHLNPEAGIKWNKSAVYAYYAEVHNWSKADVDNNVLAVLRRDETNFTTFDRRSIMLYAIPAELTTNGFSVSANSDLSAVDIGFIGGRYPFES